MKSFASGAFGRKKNTVTLADESTDEEKLANATNAITKICDDDALKKSVANIAISMKEKDLEEIKRKLGKDFTSLVANLNSNADVRKPVTISSATFPMAEDNSARSDITRKQYSTNATTPPPAPALPLSQTQTQPPSPPVSVLSPRDEHGGGGRRRTKKSKYYNKRRRTKGRRTKRRRSNKRRN
jgi:HD-GYP domain-containing protein (c-di-GMP phosphodiesterase class II)